MGLVIEMCGSLKQILVGMNCGIRLLGEANVIGVDQSNKPVMVDL